MEFHPCYQQHVYCRVCHRLCTRATLRSRMMTFLFDTASAQPHPICNKLDCRSQLPVLAHYHDSAYTSQNLAIPRLVEIGHPLNPSSLASGALPQAAQSRSPHLRKLLNGTRETPQIKLKPAKSTSQRGAGREPSNLFSQPSRQNNGTFWRPTACPALFVNIRNPRSTVELAPPAVLPLGSLLRGKRTLACGESTRLLGENKITKRTQTFMEPFLTIIYFSIRYEGSHLGHPNPRHFLETLAPATHLSLQRSTNYSGSGGSHAQI
jgi:hypothetical protein